MNLRSQLLPAARQLLTLAQKDRRAAREAVLRLSAEEQMAAICEAPLAQRGALLDLLPDPEAVVPLMPEAELCFTCKYVGVHDASSLLALATNDQIIACLDLDAWRGLAPNVLRLGAWIASLAEAGDETLLRSAQAMDPELLSLYIRHHVRVEMKPAGDEDWQPPEGGQTLEGQFYYIAIEANDDVEPLSRLLHVLFQKDYWLYFRMMQSVNEELTLEVEEWALRWRTGRLEDLGFPAWDASMRIYGFLRPERLTDAPIEDGLLGPDEWALPVWVTDLPAADEAKHSIFRAAAGLDEDERSVFFYAFVALANMVAVADQRDLGDAETLPSTLEKAASVSSLGLEHIASHNDLQLLDVLRRVPLERLFRVGVNLAPEGVRPGFSEEDDEDADVTD
jgi:hypothetical protein